MRPARIFYRLGLAAGLLTTVPGHAQAPPDQLSLSLGLGTGVAAALSYEHHSWLLLTRTRHKWWIPSRFELDGVFNRVNSRSRQTEAGLLLGRTLRAGAHRFHAAAGLAYLSGRDLLAYRYTLRRSGLTGRTTDYFAYRRYRALGLPLELGWEAAVGRERFNRLGITAQADLNPERPDFTLLATLAFPLTTR
jgi:hypothetical protein